MAVHAIDLCVLAHRMQLLDRIVAAVAGVNVNCFFLSFCGGRALVLCVGLIEPEDRGYNDKT
jgi:hypothetical protein